MKTLYIVKSSGEREPFSREKYVSSLKRAQLSDAEIENILLEILPQIYDGMTTRELYLKTFDLLKSKKPSASRYSLKYALKLLGPTGFPFEQLVAHILVAEGYTVKTDQIMRGQCVTHEVDVLAQKNGKYTLVECKFHIRPDKKSAIQTSLYVKARFDDIASVKKEPLGGSLLVTNTEFTTEAIHYCECVGIDVLAWEYPDDRGLDHLIERHKLYPITVLITLKPAERAMLLDEGIILCKQLMEKINSVPLPKDIIDQVKAECQSLVNSR